MMTSLLEGPSLYRCLSNSTRPHLHCHSRRSLVLFSSLRPYQGCPSLFSSSKKARQSQRKRRGEAFNEERGPVDGQERVAILWFKNDLRIDDHPGLIAAMACRSLLPLYIFDLQILASWKIHILEDLLEAVSELRKSLRSIGSDLIIRIGTTKDTLLPLAQAIGATDIFTEEEIEYEWSELVSEVSSVIKTDVSSRPVNFELWSAPLYDIEMDLPLSYKEFQRKGLPVKPPLASPSSLPGLPAQLDRGDMPSSSELQNILKGHNFVGITSTESNHEAMESNTQACEESEGPWHWRHLFLASPYELLQKKSRETLEASQDMAMESSINIRRSGASSARNAFDGYLRFFEPTSRDDWQELNTQILKAEERKGASFRMIFGSALMLGSLSYRRIHHESLEYEKVRNGGRLSPFGFSSITASTAVEDVKSMEWYKLLSKSNNFNGMEASDVRHWRWRGFIIQYCVSGSKGLPILLVHGFGAFWNHYRDNIKGLANKGHRVWALTLLGFGRSEKPNILYTELGWPELIKDFIVDVVREPAILVGNSIGGYSVSTVAGLWPSIVKSLILINPAGKVVPDYLSLKYMKPKEKSGFASLGGQLLLWYLRNSTSSLLKKCYPKKSWRADEDLLGEVLRASYDPGAKFVLESLFFLKPPLPINYFIDQFNGNVLLIQGSEDPLSRAPERAKMLQENCKNVTVKLIDAGHCPHDEFPEEVNNLICDWITNSSFQSDLQDEAIIKEFKGVVTKTLER